MSNKSKSGEQPSALKRLPKQVLKGMASGLGFEIRRKSSASPGHQSASDEEYQAAYKVVQNHTLVAQEGLKSLYRQAVFCDLAGIPGSYVECGVWKGGSVGMMAQANLRHSKSRRHIHLFDAYDDICEPDAKVDGERALREVREWSTGSEMHGRLVPVKGIYDRFGGHGTLEENRLLLERNIGYPADFLHYHKGWFQDTLPVHSSQIKEIALLRLDADWYASTRICLEHFFAKVVPGGFIIIDDYGAYEGCQKAVDEFLSKIAGRPAYLHEVNSEIRYLVKA